MTITGLALPFISAMPGEDPLDALVKAMYWARDILDHHEGQFLFGENAWGKGALPLPLDRGLPPSMLSEVERRASQMADEVSADYFKAMLSQA